MPTLPLTIKIKDYTYSTNITVPAEISSEPPTVIPSGLPVDILTYPPKPLICGDLGDVNGDGVIDGKDAMLVAQHTVKTVILTEDQLKRADVRGTGTPNIVDALFIIQYVKGTRTTFPGCALTKLFKGFISILSVPKPLKISYPVEIFIDGTSVGEPPITKEVDPGTHNITAKLKGMSNIYRKVNIESDKTLTITDIAFEEIEEEPVCPTGEYLDPITKTCKPLVCPTGEYLDPITKTCKKQVCQIGEQQTTLCSDGTEIVSAECKKDLVTGLNKWVLTGNVCPTPVEIRIVKILPEDETKLPDANSGETVKITATVICKTTTTISKPKDTASLIVDGAVADIKVVENGIVTFDWEATAVPISIHKICVNVKPSVNCKSPGQDCKYITVSSAILDIAKALAKEKTAVSEQKKLIEQARSKFRSDIIEAELEVPIPYKYYILPVTKPVTPTISTIPTISPVVTEPIIDYGNISIIGLPSTLLPITSDLPIYIYIDNNNIGKIYELPKTVTNIAVGTHTIYARAGVINTPTKTALVIKNETTTVTL